LTNHWYNGDVPSFVAVVKKVTRVPGETGLFEGRMDTETNCEGKTDTIECCVLKHPYSLVTITLKSPLEAAIIASVVAEVDHKYPVPPEAVSTTDPPWQKDVGPPAVMMADGNGFTVTAALSVSVQPPELVTVTVYVPPEVMFIAAVVAAVDHK
jgi:hypothetical protein